MKWIFFDLDDTLWDFSANSKVALRKLYEISPILKKLFKEIDEFIDTYHVYNQQLWDLYARGEVDSKELKVERWRRTLSTRQFEVLTAVCEELDRTYLEILSEGLEMIPGVQEFLDRLSHRCLIGIISNGFLKTQYRKLHFSGLEKYVTRTIVSDEIGVNKPDRRLFDYAVEETGATAPLLMVGDHPETDVLGAMKSGWYAIWFNRHGKTFPLSEEDLKKKGINPELYLGEVTDIAGLEKLIQGFKGW